MSYRLKLGLFFLSALGILYVLNTGYSALNTLSRLDVVEAERDQWQRPTDVVEALALRPGDVVVDLGCGSGYFTLKLAPPVGKNGRVIAEDIRRLPLAFLWFRKLGKNEHNVSIVYGDPHDPHLPSQRVNEVLIANTYHEFTDSRAILEHVRQALISGGRIVLVDRAQKPVGVGANGLAEHEISAGQVEGELRKARFEIVTREDDFIDKDPENESWWLIVARKPLTDQANPWAN